jgi:hypothetical protein
VGRLAIGEDGEPRDPLLVGDPLTLNEDRAE